MSKLLICFILYSIILLPIYGRFYTSKLYRVQPNDTYWRIGRKFNVSYKEIIRWNKKKGTKLYVGQTLRIPVPVSSSNSSSRNSRKSENIFFKPILSSKKKVNFRRTIFNPHEGILYSATKNNQVFSAKSGTVLAIDYMDGYDNYIIIKHKNNYTTIYANLSKVSVKKGQWVKDKAYLGEVFKEKGLYFQVNFKDKPINPDLYLQ